MIGWLIIDCLFNWFSIDDLINFNFKWKIIAMNFRFGQTVSGKVVWNNVRNIFWKFEPIWMRQSNSYGEISEESCNAISRHLPVFLFRIENMCYGLMGFQFGRTVSEKVIWEGPKNIFWKFDTVWMWKSIDIWAIPQNFIFEKLKISLKTISTVMKPFLKCSIQKINEGGGCGILGLKSLKNWEDRQNSSLYYKCMRICPSVYTVKNFF